MLVLIFGTPFNSVPRYFTPDSPVPSPCGWAGKRQVIKHRALGAASQKDQCSRSGPRMELHFITQSQAWHTIHQPLSTPHSLRVYSWKAGRGDALGINPCALGITWKPKEIKWKITTFSFGLTYSFFEESEHSIFSMVAPTQWTNSVLLNYSLVLAMSYALCHLCISILLCLNKLGCKHLCSCLAWRCEIYGLAVCHPSLFSRIEKRDLTFCILL